MAALSLGRSGSSRNWLYPTAIVNWYYSVYMAARAVLAVKGLKPADTHSSTSKTWASSIAHLMPHPLDMRADHNTNESYDILMPCYPSTKMTNLVSRFDDAEEVARGMLLQYLKGTARYSLDEIKEKLKRRLKLTDFRRKEARIQRDRACQKKIGFLHCAYRYRGKANYRDALYLTLGSQTLRMEKSFCDDLGVSARFLVLLALATAEVDMPRSDHTGFINDLNSSLKGEGESDEGFRLWKSL